jgi:hypothetical protein
VPDDRRAGHAKRGTRHVKHEPAASANGEIAVDYRRS